MKPEKPETQSGGTVQDAGWDKRVALIALLPFCLLFFSPGAAVLPSVVLYSLFWVLALFDFRFYRLPNVGTAALFVSGCVQAYLSPRFDFADHVVGAVIGLLFFPLVNFVYKTVRGRNGIGLGDAKLLGGIGMWLGWPHLPFVLLISSLSGLLYALLGLVAKQRPIASMRIPFGPFLCFGAWVVWLNF